MIYVDFQCQCCGGKWRTRVEFPRALARAYVSTMTGWCRRCGRGDCSAPRVGPIDERVCKEGRRVA